MRAIFIFIIMAIGLFAFGQRQDTTVRNGMLVEEGHELSGDTIYENFNCDQKATFPGGDRELMKYVADHLKYPGEAEECGIEGTVYIRFIITKSGEIGQVTVMRAVDPKKEEEAIRVIKSLPKWNPAIKGGKPVNAWFIMPVKFILH